jgi:hypothetical protein
MTCLTRGLAPLLAVAAAAVILLAPAGSPTPVRAADPALSAWDGGVNLYRKGVFTTQQSWLWCTAADVQIVRNIVDDQEDHTTSGQRRYFAWMRERNRYTLPLSAGVDPQGWTAGMRHFVDDRYRLVASTTFDNALRSAVKRLRLTNLPVALAVSHGNHGWVLTGFTATADPAATASFTVTSVRVVGPLYGLQSRNGYDMPPNTKLTPTQLKRYFTPWRYAPKRMIWDGRYVSIQPVPVPAAPGPAVAGSSPGAPSAAPTAPAPTAPAFEPRAAVIAPPGTQATIPEIGSGAGPAFNPARPAPGRPDATLPMVALALIAAAGAGVVGLMARRARPLRSGGS